MDSFSKRITFEYESLQYIEVKYKYSVYNYATRMAMQLEEEKAASNWLRETQKGYIRIATLILLSKKPHHGYEIMKEIKDRTRGFWRPTAGGIYPILQDLEESKYIQGEWDAQTKRKRKIYKITEAGRMVLIRALAKENQVASSMRDLFEEYMKDVLDVKARPNQMPRIPSPFSRFLEDREEKPEATAEILEDRRKQIQDMIKQLQKQMRTIDKRLAR
jgi:DNA-binding PadR family transcriptional regulator